MTTMALITVIVRCPNPFSRRHGKEIGRLEVSDETVAIIDTRYCGWCRESHRQTIRFR
jgi:hypothetical protein